MASEYTTISVILYKSKTLSNGEHPIMLRVSKNRVRKYISLGVSCNIDDWDFKQSLPKKRHPNKDTVDSIIARALKEHKDKLMDFKHEGKDFTPDVLIAETNKSVRKTTVLNYFAQKIQHLKDCKQIGNSKVYNDTCSQLKIFTGNRDITFSQLDYNLLLKFEGSLKVKGISDNAISVRFRTIRALFNSAIAEGYAKKDLYPFDKFKISERYSTKTQKRAITKEDVKKVEAVVLKKDSAAFEAQQYFLFSYYGWVYR